MTTKKKTYVLLLIFSFLAMAGCSVTGAGPETACEPPTAGQGPTDGVERPATRGEPDSSESSERPERPETSDPVCPLFVGKDPLAALEETYMPENLRQVQAPTAYDIKRDVGVELSEADEQSLYDETTLTDEAAAALEQLIESAKEDSIELYAYSGYRSYRTQTHVFDRNVRRLGREQAERVSAVPGHSEHQTGLAMDFTSKSLIEVYEQDRSKSPLIQEFGEHPEGIWLAENAYKYGFIMSYPEGKEEITGYDYEPWHFRYVGKELAKTIYESKITLNEYVAETCKGKAADSADAEKDEKK